MNTVFLTLAAAGLAIALCFLPMKGAHAMSPELVREKLAANAVILDVRTPEEFAQGSYPGAINIPVQVLAERLAEVPTERPVVVYCAAGKRAAMAQQILNGAGYADVTNGGGLCDMPQ